MSKGSANRTTCYSTFGDEYQQVDMLKDEDRWLKKFIRYEGEEDIWVGFDEIGLHTVCWAFTQCECVRKLKEYRRGTK